jgi:hypothetical protein
MRILKVFQFNYYLNNFKKCIKIIFITKNLATAHNHRDSRAHTEQNENETQDDEVVQHT